VIIIAFLVAHLEILARFYFANVKLKLASFALACGVIFLFGWTLILATGPLIHITKNSTLAMYEVLL